jgi:hypothetical protein
MLYTIRLINYEDADFILSLRNNPKYNRFLNPTSQSLEDQLAWIKEYKLREAAEKEFYYLIYENGHKRGLYRLYKINNVSFTLGSWIFLKCDNNLLPVYTDILLSELGFEVLNKTILLFDIRKENRKVVHYHLLKQPLLYSEDDLNNYYLIQFHQWGKARNNIFAYFGIHDEDYFSFKKGLMNDLQS